MFRRNKGSKGLLGNKDSIDTELVVFQYLNNNKNVALNVYLKKNILMQQQRKEVIENTSRLLNLKRLSFFVLTPITCYSVYIT